MYTGLSARLPAAALAAAIALVGLTPAHADDTAGAARAYQQAQAATLAGDHGRAGELFELADQLAPSPQALRSAARARRAAGQLAQAATLAEQMLERYPADEPTRGLADTLLGELRPDLLRVRLTCDEPCTVSIDGYAAETSGEHRHVLYTTPGGHALSVVFAGGRSVDRAVNGGAGAAVQMQVAAPNPAEVATTATAIPYRDSSTGLRRGWFVAGTLLTVGLGTATVWSGLDVLDQHDLYEQQPTPAGFDDGRRRERRTNLLLGATAVAATSTLLIAIFTDWSPTDREAPRGTRLGVAPATGGGMVTFGGSL